MALPATAGLYAPTLGVTAGGRRRSEILSAEVHCGAFVAARSHLLVLATLAYSQSLLTPCFPARAAAPVVRGRRWLFRGCD